MAYFTIPKEEVELYLAYRKKGKIIAKLKKIIKPSSYRVKPLCPYFGKCGGCLWQMMDYNYQLKIKKQLINKAFKKAGFSFSLNKIIPSPSIFHYRNNMEFAIGFKREVGLKPKDDWRRIIDLDKCFLISEKLFRIMIKFKQVIRKLKLDGWDNKNHKGFLRYLVLREGKFTNKKMAIIISSEQKITLSLKKQFIKHLSPYLTSLYWGINPKITDIALSEKLELLYGEKYLKEKINNFSFLIHPHSFFQTNSEMASKLMEEVLKLIPPFF